MGAYVSYIWLPSWVAGTSCQLRLAPHAVLLQGAAHEHLQCEQDI